ncbi:O-sialoglycoprotein endopeptidase [Legionella birminghamensis]|uniref:tRNA threonylcarbamoyladenosine biosynthesis protein TsaB n=1 Tax=Legionella birminghamensis TaxID=28083 RepID=A0A378ICZ8_9GAMM|nr:tRNA (adenosine(37)-N6)-threonylcarbamoyltransferase complex dimerization subunit type 1 TsaB [Legionella birminghamensis]KTC71732.1 O-sialoglycoprotein endopeptidase [Legionella birminghamensis]STX32431.1 glycoprotease (O-sialoglycoprotein endopeptidase) [Legionella birminghamensis]
MKKLLSIDTSTSHAFAAISIDGSEMVIEQSVQRKHAQTLLPMIEELLASHQTSLQQLDGIVFGQGPGSFTGLRIACSVAKALAYAHDLPLFPVSSLMAIAWNVRTSGKINPECPILAMIDARMQQVYWGIFNDRHETVEQVSDPVSIHVGSGEAIVLAGIGFEPYLPLLPESTRGNISQQIETYPNALSMIHLVQAGKIFPVDVAAAAPVYIRNKITQ